MFTESVSDPTAGQRAQRAKFHPELPQPILDPTDPRCGASEPASEIRPSEPEAVEEPSRLREV
jgi:hypothetical protein